MSPSNVGNFVQDLVEMAKATEQLPLVQADLDRANSQIEAYATQVQRLEMRLIDKANEIETLHAKLQQAEVDRDNAETMFLQESDRTQAALSLVRTFMDQGKALLDAQSPSPAMPVAVDPSPTPESAVERQAEPVTDLSTLLSEPIPAVLISGDPANIDSVSSGPQGSSAADPTEAPPSTTDGMTTPTDATNASSKGVSVSSDPTPATETTSENASPGSMPSEAPMQPDDVGYHNEPQGESNYGDWGDWAKRMDARYGYGHWPDRSTT